MKRIALSLVAVAMVAGVVAALAQTSSRTDVKSSLQSAKEVRGASPYTEIKNEPAPKLIVDPPLPDLLDQGVVWIQWRAENLNIVPVFGKGALNVSPRVGHLHVQVDDLPWWWADVSNVNTIDLAGMPAGPHKILVEVKERECLLQVEAHRRVAVGGIADRDVLPHMQREIAAPAAGSLRRWLRPRRRQSVGVARTTLHIVDHLAIEFERRAELDQPDRLALSGNAWPEHVNDSPSAQIPVERS